MNNSYDVHSWRELYREERLREAGALRLEGRLRTARSVPPENHKKGGKGANEVTLRIRTAALVAAVFLLVTGVTGATLAASVLAGEDRAASAQIAQELGLSTSNTGNSQSTG